jgi:6-phosphofructokinase
LAGGADVILIPEIPYQIEHVAGAIRQRSRGGKGFSIVAVAEGSMSVDDSTAMETAREAVKTAKESGDRKVHKKAKKALRKLEAKHVGNTLRLTRELERLTTLESRLTILGHVQRGGTPTPYDRLLATRLGTACTKYIEEGVGGVMIAARGEKAVPVPLEKVAGKCKVVPQDHLWVQTARDLGLCLGDC